MAYKIRKLLALTLVLTAILLGGTSLAAKVFAAGNFGQTYTLLEPLPCIEDKTLKCPPTAKSGEVPLLTEVNLGDFFQYAFNLLIALSGVAAVFMMVWGGFLYVSSTSFQDKSKGREYFSNAIWGLLFVLFAYLILRTVNPKLVSFPKSIPAIQNRSNTIAPGDFFSMVDADIAKYQLAVQDAKKARDAAQASVQSLQNDILDLQKQYSAAVTANDETKITEIQVKIAEAESKISEERANLVVSLTKAMANETLSTMYQNPIGPDFSPEFNREAFGSTEVDQREALQTYIANLNTSYNYKVQLLKKYDINQIPPAMVSEKKFAENMILLGLYTEDQNRSRAVQDQISKINEIKTKVIPTIIDPQEKENLTKAVETALKNRKDSYNYLRKIGQ